MTETNEAWRKNILTGWTLRRHIARLWLQSLSCIVRGRHTPEYDEDWKDTFCGVCGKLLDE